MDVHIHHIDATVTLDEEELVEVKGGPDEFDIKTMVREMDTVELGDLVSNHFSYLGDAEIASDGDVRLTIDVSQAAFPSDGEIDDEELINLCAKELEDKGLDHELCRKEKVIERENDDTFRVKAMPAHTCPTPRLAHTCPAGLVLTTREQTMLVEMWNFMFHGAESATGKGYGPAWFKAITGRDGGGADSDDPNASKNWWGLIRKIMRSQPEGIDICDRYGYGSDNYVAPPTTLSDIPTRAC